ncbi:hypothetical protein FS842_005098 [Serendipita sp. 407]|nr:hypothetical protein FS842_005098 [Serendipita sp. 407]
MATTRNEGEVSKERGRRDTRIRELVKALLHTFPSIITEKRHRSVSMFRRSDFNVIVDVDVDVDVDNVDVDDDEYIKTTHTQPVQRANSLIEGFVDVRRQEMWSEM